MQKNGLGLRTTIVVNIALVMFITMLLISFLVLTITRKTIFDYKVKTGETIVRSLQNNIISSLSSFDDTTTGLQNTIDNFIAHAGDLASFSIVDKSHRVVADRDKTRVGLINKDPHINEALAMGTQVKNVRPYRGKDHLFISTPLYQGNQLRGVLQAVFSLNDIEESMSRYQHTLIIFTVMTALMFIVIGSVLLTRYLVKPLEKLIKATEDITEGYVPRHLEASGQNEIGTLSLSLARMTDKLRDDKEEIKSYIHSLEDSNTQLKKAQGDVIRSEKLSSVGRLAAGIAHEIGNPIGIILGYIEILRDNGNNHNENTDALSRLENEVMRIDAIIRELLSFSRPTTVAPHPIQVNPIIEEATSFIVHQKAFSTITVDLHLAESLPCIMADERQLQQVMVNLFLNSMDAMPEGGTLSIATSQSNPAHNASPAGIPLQSAMTITVKDTGTGMQGNDINKIFDPFYTTKSPGKGTGLGLSVCLSIVESFEGTLSVESTPGKGTIFTIVFPTVSIPEAAHL